jgi:hypothetical protein
MQEKLNYNHNLNNHKHHLLLKKKNNLHFNQINQVNILVKQLKIKLKHNFHKCLLLYLLVNLILILN